MGQLQFVYDVRTELVQFHNRELNSIQFTFFVFRFLFLVRLDGLGSTIGSADRSTVGSSICLAMGLDVGLDVGLTVGMAAS